MSLEIAPRTDKIMLSDLLIFRITQDETTNSGASNDALLNFARGSSFRQLLVFAIPTIFAAIWG